MQENVIIVENVTKVYKLYENPQLRLKEALSITRKSYHEDYYALKNLSFNVRKGQCVGIIGKNGSGKSTILKILTGVLTQTSGFVNVNGKISALLELGAGFNLEYSGIENIYLNGSIMGFSKEEMDMKLDNIIDFASIGEFIYQPVKRYSSGMFVRLAFAVAINVDPDILIIDEALSVGDEFFQLKCFKKFNEFKEAGKTIIFVTHDTNTVIKYCNSAILLSEGHKIAEGEPKEIVDLYKQSVSGLLNEYITDIFEPPTNVELVETIQEKPKNTILEHVFEKPLKELLEINQSALIYGNEKATIIDFAILDHDEKPTSSLEKDKICSFYMKVKFNEDVKEPIFAYAIKDITGLEITGSNSMLENIDTGKCSKGETFEILFKQKMNLQGGPYFLSLGCTGFNKKGELEVFHRLYDILHIGVSSTKVSTGFYDMNSQTYIKKIES